ncbi:hypothetical protein [Mucilaginibacter myungsuensis]|uniref:Uncharacterized protein n=1 Tax=Mucilaginibacter myungsuensis TaxID=649104 RepID=A0A929KZ76_9SPHI|nr:hypothetical protein [Mucilaginibacter myungsuensis]MBE9663163.1 hypothetical protein [Mucilaginibacter myungsuensis]MDN3598798.1 hypothetical protein [Mucilaginibacter myungsuensis]
MTTLFFQLQRQLSLMIVPDTLAHLNGHTIITHTYSIYKDTGMGDPLLSRSKESTLHLEKIDDPNYFGFITFEMPDKLFSYTADGALELEAGEAQEIIEFLSDVRTNPSLWKNIDQ